MRRKSRAFLENALASLVLAVQAFNSASDLGRTNSVVMLLNHAFEMLLKAAIFERTGRIRARRTQFNYTFNKCVNICETQLGLIDSDISLILRNVNGFRDAVEHDLLHISERLLYAHVQSGVMVFDQLLRDVFGLNLADRLPTRVLPVSTLPPWSFMSWSRTISTPCAPYCNLAGGAGWRQKRSFDPTRSSKTTYGTCTHPGGVQRRAKSWRPSFATTHGNRFSRWSLA